MFVDAIDTGFSRVVSGVNNQQFHDQEGDIRAFGEFIAEYLKTYSRWPSPKFLIGESYGTIRSAGLSQELQTRHGVELNGIVLVSSLLTYQTLSPSPNNDVAYADQIQTFAATAWYHKKLPADLQQKTIKQVVDEARGFAFGEYLQALTKGNTPERRRARGDGRQAGALHGAVIAVHPERQPPRGFRPLPEGVAARQAAGRRDASTPASPRSTPTPPASGRSSTRRTPRSRAPTSPSSRTT